MKMGVRWTPIFSRERGQAVRKLMWFGIGFAVACLLAGYWIQRQDYLPAVVICCIVLAGCLAFMLKFRRARVPAVGMLGCLVGFCWLFAHDELHLSSVRAYDEQRVELSIVALDAAEPTQYGCRVLGLTKIDGKFHKIMLYLYQDDTATLGDTISGSFLLRSTLEDGSRDSLYNRGEGIFLMATSGENLIVSTPEQLPWFCYPAKARQSLTALMDRIFPEDTVGFARALLLGDTDGMDYKTNSDLKISGIAHVVAVSGMHVTILFGLIYFLTCRRRFLVVLIGFPVLFFFAAMVGFAPSITRACLMNGLMMVGLLFDRDYDSFTSLAFAVIMMLLGNPYVIVSVSFQLSVMCMVGMFLFAEPVRQWLMEQRRLGRFKKCRRLVFSFATAVGIALGASITTAPLCAIYFGMVSIVSLLTNILTLWIITYVFYGIMAACLAAGIFLPIGVAVARLCGVGIRLVLDIVELFAAFPLAAVYTYSIYISFWLAFCYILLGVYCRMKRKRPVTFGCLAAIGLCLSLLLSWSEPYLDNCRVTVLDVGQGQCILLQAEGRTFMVDCGGVSDASAADTAAAALLSQGISRLDGLIITHFDSDHAGAAENLLSRVAADTLYLPDCVDEEGVSLGLRFYSGGQVQKVKDTMQLQFGEAIITIVPSQMGNVDNESGLCILFQRENCDILITGDRSQVGERELMRSVELPKLEVLIVGHHGSKTSTCEELLDKTTPEIAIISVGDNSFGHPAQEVLDRLQAYGCVIYRTDLNGTVIYRG